MTGSRATTVPSCVTETSRIRPMSMRCSNLEPMQGARTRATERRRTATLCRNPGRPATLWAAHAMQSVIPA
jgi:hypothetical protein